MFVTNKQNSMAMAQWGRCHAMFVDTHHIPISTIKRQTYQRPSCWKKY